MKILRPTGTRPDRTQPFTLAGRAYALRLVWFARSARWRAELYDEDGTLLAGSVKVLPGWPMCRRWRNPAMPDVVLLPIDLAPDTGPLGLEDVNDRLVILLVGPGDVPPAEPDDTQTTVVSVTVDP